MRNVLIITIAVVSTFLNAQPLTFRQNKNQWPKKVHFAAELGTGQLFIEQDRLTWSIFSEADIEKEHSNRNNKSENSLINGHNFQMCFSGAMLRNPHVSGTTPTYYNYFLGNDKARWASGVKAFREVSYSNIYDGVDLNFYGAGSKFKYDLIVRKGYDLSVIKLQYQHVNSVSLKEGKLQIETSVGTITESIPEAYQLINGKKKIVKCNYKLNDNTVSFEAEYDRSHDLVIDPVVVVSSYSGTESVSYGLGLIPDEQGYMYLSSMNITKHYPVTMGAIQLSFGGGFYDCAVSKFDPSGSMKIFSTYIGGNREELVLNVASKNGEVNVFGWTTSDTFPILQNGFQIKHGGNRDYFIVKMDSTGEQILASTYLGGKRQEALLGISNGNGFYSDYLGELIVDDKRNCYILGNTISIDYPVTANCIRCNSDSTSFGDLVITKLNPSLASLEWSTYLGGSLGESPASVIFTRDGNLLCAGNSASSDFPTTPAVLSNTKAASSDIVLFEMNADNGSLLASTYVPLKTNETAYRIACDINDNVYVAGSITSPLSLTATPGAYNNANGNVLFLKISPELDELLVLSKFGYSNTQNKKVEVDAFNVDSCGNIYFGGFALPTFPVTPDAIKSQPASPGNMYIGVFKPDFTSLTFGSYYGSDGIPGPQVFPDHDDGGLNYIDKRGNFYHAVCTYSTWPVSAGAYAGYNITDPPQQNFYPNSDAFVKIDLQTFVNANSTFGGELRSCSPITATFAASPNFGTVTIIPGDGSPGVSSNSLIHTYNVYGTYNALIIAGTDTTTCNHTDSIKIKIAYGPPPEKPLDDFANMCKGINRVLDAKNPGASYFWNTGENTQLISPQQEGLYVVLIDNHYCTAIDSTRLKKLDAKYPMILPNIISPNNDGANDSWNFAGHAVSEASFEVYNRWGKLVYKSEDPMMNWNGVNQNGEPLSDGTYFWIIDYISNCEPKENVKEKGFIQIVR